jgi:phosphatidylglycerophosphatase A
MKTVVASVLATWFGCGKFPFGPGSIGSAAAILIAYTTSELLRVSPLLIGLCGFAIAPVGIWAAGIEARRCGREDPSQVVIDEVSGQWIAIGGAAVINGLALLAAFALFRLFDIWKPWPVRRLENLPGGLGIMADDVMAGIYAALVLALAGWLNLY